ncbi:MAG: hypothetical protein A2X61_07555 [Ignavibacteria bacterium GWB2_35_12]|nr:MAG: hypothetical protein A2X63_12855 [Ignavibacteria bacterium GWA2_35_8]OGU39182.1 MAG: hypothetical protein A2X61_07555 [Ignavibacteria bacterium GWB2_35_12]OGU89210.1 MAG: hypothetical protein A2220_00945 [Ignavibacteria bacterium RIFOXYA2_FULL_35_10]OGV21048.1 MAG: hypothetical protein A2475_00845 [Ignavibacteria bacterium RIFOXYC2_FULL_35_21]
MKNLLLKILFTFLLVLVFFSSAFAQKYFNTITLINDSGEKAFVKIVGPTELQVEVPKKKNVIVNVSSGTYYILVRYGNNPKNYSFTKGDPFIITQTEKEYTAISITLNKTVGGNYNSNPSTSDEFNKGEKVFADSSSIIVPLSEQYSNDPGLEDNEILITTIPLGLKIYLAPDKDSLKSTLISSNLQIQSSHYLIDSINFKGYSPLILKDIKPGKFLIAVEPVKIIDDKLKLSDIDESMKPTALVSTDVFPNMATSDKKGMFGAIVYFYEKGAVKGERIIILSVPHELPIAKMEQYYPSASKFVFDEVELKKEIKNNGFNNKETNKAIELLHRGGKIRLNGKDVSLFIEIQNNGSWRIGTLQRTKNQD